MSRVVKLENKTGERTIASSRVVKKNNIIKIAAKLFSQKSFHDVTMDEIAEKVGVAKGTIYLYFSSKDNLYLEILEHTFGSIEALLEKEVNKASLAPEKLKKVLAIVIKFYRENIDVLKILSRDETHLIQEHHDLTEKWRLRRIELYEKIIEKGIKEGSFKTRNTELAALVLYGAVGAVMVFYDLEKSPEAIAEEMYSEIASGFFH
jgi:AcrR family transcriptional regulator